MEQHKNTLFETSRDTTKLYIVDLVHQFNVSFKEEAAVVERCSNLITY